MPEKQQSPIRLIGIGILVAYGVAFVLLNNDQIEINFIFFKQRGSLIVALILMGALGFVVGFLAHMSYKRKNKAR
jgi:uncharacterized integral membrane protein